MLDQWPRRRSSDSGAAGVEIREVRAGELPALGALTVAAYTAEPEAWSDEEYLAELGNPAPRAEQAVVLVAVDGDGRLLGGVTYVPGPGPYAWFDNPAEAGVRMLAVAPEAQRRGIGTRLVHACLERAAAERRTRLLLHTTESMVTARRLYERLGFRRATDRDEVFPSGFRLWAYEYDLRRLGIRSLALPIAVVVGAAAAVTALAAWTSGRPPAIDAAVARFSARTVSEGGFRAAGVFSRMGSTEVVVPIGMVMAAALVKVRRSWAPAVLVAAAYVLAAIPAGLLKQGLERPEPYDALEAMGRSFPSGHATQAAAVWGIVAVLVLATVTSPWARRLAVVTAGLVPLAVGLAMLARNAHWLTDVIAGYIIAAGSVVAVATAGNLWSHWSRRHWLHRHRGRQPEVVGRE